MPLGLKGIAVEAARERAEAARTRRAEVMRQKARSQRYRTAKYTVANLAKYTKQSRRNAAKAAKEGAMNVNVQLRRSGRLAGKAVETTRRAEPTPVKSVNKIEEAIKKGILSAPIFRYGNTPKYATKAKKKTVKRSPPKSSFSLGNGFNLSSLLKSLKNK